MKSINTSPDRTASSLPSHPKYRADIDGLRALAIIFVVSFHAFPSWLRGGFIGVDIFFVISGFLISTIIIKNLEGDSFSFIDFYSRRIKRIFPALLLVLTTCMVFGWFALLADEYKLLGKHVAAGAGFVSNIVLWRESGYFDISAETKPLLHLWSLGIEEQFYLAWPILLWLAWKRRIPLAATIFTLALISFLLNIIAIKPAAVATFYSPQTRIWELLIGALLAQWSLSKETSLVPAWLGKYCCEKIPVSQAAVNNSKAWLGAALIAAALFFITKDRLFPGGWALLPTLGAALIISAGAEAWLNRRVLSHSLLVWLGLISFPLYLWHWPLLSFARIVESETPHYAIRLTAIAAAVVLAWLTYTLVEAPVRFGRQRIAKVKILVLLMFIVGSAGFNINKFDGLAFRDPLKSQNYVAQKIEQQFSDKCSMHFAKISHCAETAPRGKPIVLLVGDSHVRHTYEMIKKQVIAKGYDLIAFSNGGCPFVMGVNARYVDDCAIKNDEVMAFIETNKDRIKVVVVAAEYTTYIKPDWLKDVNGATVGLATALNKTLASLGQLPVVLFEQIPLISFDPKKCLSRPFRISSNQFNCQLDRAQVMESMKASRAAVSEAHSEFTNITLFNVDDILCKDSCRATYNNELMYYNETHLNPIGVDFVRTQIKFDEILPAAK